MHVADDDSKTLQFQCGVEPQRLQEWVSSRDFSPVRIVLEPWEKRTLGSVSLPVTYVTITGPSSAVEEVYHEFELTFMSAGG